MRKPAFSFSISAIFLALVVTIAFAASPREQLTGRGLKFNADSFQERAGAGDLEAVKLYLAAGMNANIRPREPRWGGTDKTHSQTPFIAAVNGGHLDIMSYMARNGAAIDNKYDLDNTPLMVAAVNGHTEIVRWLVAKGADVNAKGAYEQTPLIYAAMFGSVDTVRILLEHEAEVNARDSLTADTALDKTNNREIIRLLKEAGGKKASELK